MAVRTDEITEEVKAIARTRAEISEKAEQLGCQIQSTVEQTKDGVRQVVEHARDTAVDFAQETKRTLDPAYQIMQHAWIIGGAVMLWYVVGRLGNRRRHTVPWQQVATEAKDFGAEVTKGLTTAKQEILKQVIPEVQDEFVQLRERFISIGSSFLQKMVRRAITTIADPLEAALSRERPISRRQDRPTA